MNLIDRIGGIEIEVDHNIPMIASFLAGPIIAMLFFVGWWVIKLIGVLLKAFLLWAWLQ